MTIDRQTRPLAAVATPGQRVASVAYLHERVKAGNEAYVLKSDPRWNWYSAVIAEGLAEAEQDLKLWLETDSNISPLDFNGAVLAHQKTMRAVARERVNFLRWAVRLVDDAISGRDEAEVKLARLRTPVDGGAENP